MSKYLKSLRILPCLVLLFSFALEAQYFDTLIFKTYGYYWEESIIYMGDQNDDGFDDFLVCAMDSITGPYGKARFFYGGNPMDTIPEFTIPFYTPKSITACDINRDGYRDIVSMRFNPIFPVYLDVYFGGNDIDTIKDHSFPIPDTSREKRVVFKGHDGPMDLDGDGYEELVYTCPTLYVTTRNKYISGIYIMKTNTNLSPMSYKLVTDYPDTLYYNNDNWMYFGDIDGDGKDDMTFYQHGVYTELGLKDRRRFYYGNDSLDFSNYYQFSDDTLEGTRAMFITEDMNKDGKSEIGVVNWTGSYATAISYGTPRPPDITPDVVLRAGIQYAPGFSPGDVNGDGYNDLVKYLPYYNQALFLGGANVSGLVEKYYYARSSFFGLNFGGRVGDVNGDGIDDICIGENGFYEHSPSGPAGNVYIYKGTRTPVSVKEGSVEDLSNSSMDIVISPNPTNGKANLHYSLPGSGVLTIEIFDILGQRIYNNSTQEEKGSHTKELNIQNFAATTGIYIFHFTLKTGEKSLTKSVKVQLIK